MLGRYRVSLLEVEWTSFPEAGGRDNILNYDRNARNHIIYEVSWLETLKTSVWHHFENQRRKQIVVLEARRHQNHVFCEEHGFAQKSLPGGFQGAPEAET